MTKDEIKKAKAKGFIFNTRKLAKRSARRPVLRKILGWWLFGSMTVFALFSVVFAVQGDLFRATMCLTLSILAWTQSHDLKHAMEREKREAMDGALAITSLFGGLVGSALNTPRPEEDPCPVCKGSGRIGDDIPCTACDGDGRCTDKETS